MKEFVKIANAQIQNTETKILIVEFSSEKDLYSLFTPKLQNIDFLKNGKQIQVMLNRPEFRSFFNNWVLNCYTLLRETKTTSERINKFNNEIKAIVLLGQKEKKLSMSSARGLFGEFLVLKNYLNNKKYSQLKVLEGWHRPAPANHDFDYTDHTIEVKTVSRSITTVKITTEDQLTAADRKELRLCLFKIENVKKSPSDSLGKLFNEIKEVLEPGLINLFEMKCAEDVFCEYLGPEHMPLDYKFIVIEEALYIVDQIEFPRIKKDELDNGISKVSYNLDISAIEKFKIS